MPPTTTLGLRDQEADLAAQVLAAVVDSVPYSSASQYHEYFGEAPVPPRYGMSCAFQSFEVGRRLAALGGPQVAYLVDGRHVAAVVRREDGFDVLDPYLMHREPLRLRLEDDPGSGTVTTSVPALPVRTSVDGTVRPGRVRAVWRPAKAKLRLEYIRFRPAAARYAVSRVFTVDTAKELRAAPPPAGVVRPLLVHPEQNNVGIRAVDPESLQVRELIFPLTGAEPGGAPSATGLLVRDNQGAVTRSGEPGFDRLLADLARSVGSSTDDVVDVVLGAARIHRRVAPAGLEMPDYQVVDE
jgi:hypothetical protein